MTKEEAIEVLIANYPASCYGKLREAVDEAIEALEQPSAQPEKKWVPVREELPREYGLYLITTRKGNVYLWTYKPGMEEIWINLVTAWCYLPEPYKA